MTINLFYVDTRFAMAVTDRRLSYAPGQIASDRAKKLLLIQCQDACLAVAFNGYAGRGEKDTPLHWLEREAGLADRPLVDLAAKVKSVIEARLRGVPSDAARLSVTLVGYWYLKPVIYHLSNYESLETGTTNPSAEETMVIEPFLRSPMFVQTGYWPHGNRVLSERTERLRAGTANERQVKKHLLKIARDVPFTDDRGGVVGTNCHCVVLYPDGSSRCTVETIGGSSVAEYPSFISSGARYTDIMIGEGGDDGPAWGHPERRNIARLKERNCTNPRCEGRVPDGQNLCATCGHAQADQTK